VYKERGGLEMIGKIKEFLGFDIKEEKYALVDDPFFWKSS